MPMIGRILLRVCAAVWVAIALPHAASSQVFPWMEDNVDRRHGDVAGPIPVADPSECEARCGGRSDCVAWTFLRSAAPTCWLKGPEVPAVVSSNCCVSGLRPETIDQGMENNIDRWGNDVERRELPARFPSMCQGFCRADARCAAWTYVRPGVQGAKPVCYLKRPAPGPRGDACCISGTREVLDDVIRIRGHQIVLGPVANVSRLGTVDTSAQCPDLKVAIGAGYTITPPSQFPDVRFGLEIKQALPQGNSALVTVRNAHVTQDASVRAIAVCIDPTLMALRNVDVRTGAGTEAVAACGPSEQVIGGGFKVDSAHHPETSAPRSNPNGPSKSGWVLRTKQRISAFPATVRAICAQGLVPLSVDGWEIVANSQETALSGRSDATLRLSCPQNKALLSAGVSGFGRDIALLTGSLEPGGDVSTWQALLLNRDIFGAAGSVRGRMVAICVRT